MEVSKPADNRIVLNASKEEKREGTGVGKKKGGCC